MLTPEQRLELQQLRLLEWAEHTRSSESTSDELEPKAAEEGVMRDDEWALTAHVDLHPWQERAVAAWFAAGRRGTIKVVTGAGKTVGALAIIERLHREDPDLQVAVVVPTVVLMEQWYDVLTRRAGLPESLVGRLGGGHKETLSGSRRILIVVLATARKELPGMVRRADLGDHLLLIVDESHRAGAPQMSAVLETPRAYSLGLSATPERGEGDIGDEESELLWDELGGIVFELGFADAIEEGLLPPFRIDHYGLPLSPSEARRYETLTRSVSDARKELTAMSPAARRAGGGEALMSWARRVSGRGSGNLSAVASRFVNDTTRRKQLLYRAEARTEAASILIREELQEHAGARVIVFHESIAEVVELYERLVREGVPVVMEHSELPTELRERSLELFRDGLGQVVVSARSLIEGFNVPEADLGIVVASSSSPRQRIQSIGRVLRTHRDARGEEKTSRICVLYIRDTVDEAIYERYDWERLVGLDRNRYFHWSPPTGPIEQEGPPRATVPTEREVDLDALSPGDEYPGRYQGEEFGTDRLDNVVDPGGAIALNPQDVPARVAALRGGPGRFRVTPHTRAILVRVPVGEVFEVPATQLQLADESSVEQLPLGGSRDEEWVTRYAGRLKEQFRFPSLGDTPGSSIDPWMLAPGDPYEGPLEPARELRFKQRAGGTIARRVRGGEEYAHGPAAETLLEVLRELTRSHGAVSRFYVNELGHAFWREAGAARFIAALDAELEFPERAA
jgi:superfamily II DNA or RNA helicase